MKNFSNAIELRNLTVGYKSTRSFFRKDYFIALDDISFNIRKGETLGVVGRNGCGKTTLLRVLANIYAADKGTVQWNCHTVSLLSLSVGFDEELSGKDNAVIGGMFLGARKREILAKLCEITDFSELGDFIDKPVKTYSAGMRLRLGFSVALHVHPDVLLIDEVLAVGDGRFKEKAERAMVNKIRTNQTVVLVSHSLGQVEQLCDRTLWLERGRMRMVGNTSEVLTKYADFLCREN